MRKVMRAWGAVALVLAFAGIAAAQGTGRINGEILDKDGKPWADLTVEIKNPDNGQTLTVKTDKNGRFVQLGLRSAIYTITILSPKDNIAFPSKFQVADAQENQFKLNYKEELEKNAAAHPDAVKAKEEEENKFKMMKVHFDAGVAAMNDANDISKQLKTAAGDQKGSLQQKRAAECETALTEFQQSEQGVGPKEVSNHAMVWGNLGQAQECAGHFEDASKSFQNAIDLKPQGNYYAGLSTNLAKAAVAQNDAKVTEAKVADASASCEKAVALDPAAGASCWKNVGIVLSNKVPKDAVAPLQKATQAEPKDAQSWYLLGGALSANIDTKQQGEKLIYIIPPGTVDAYQKCVDADANGPYSKICKEAMDGINALSGGESTTVGKKKKG
jgi:tetratricopeptide (TPR) repeat protein